METQTAKPSKRKKSYFYPALQHLLYRSGRKQADVCASTGYSSAYISQMANGERNPRIETWIPIAEFFGLTIEQFVHLARLLNAGSEPDVAYNTATHTVNNISSSHLDSIFEEIRAFWIKEKGDSAKSILALSSRFPEVTEWAERQIIMKNIRNSELDPK